MYITRERRIFLTDLKSCVPEHDIFGDGGKGIVQYLGLPSLNAIIIVEGLPMLISQKEDV